ncbi:hypothetical protein NUKP71_51550 [Klebsiella quasipneumoniae]|nr:hypothetical protein NUKP71_51550 [Klebsiella quasipneumoniae]
MTSKGDPVPNDEKRKLYRAWADDIGGGTSFQEACRVMVRIEARTENGFKILD